jgi:hypothetical protein
MAIPVDLEALKQWLRQMPVLVDMHPLLPLCFEEKVEVVTEPSRVLRMLDEREYALSKDTPMLITGNHPSLLSRFPSLRVLGSPSIDAINQNFHHHLHYAQKNLLTTVKIADYLTHDVGLRHYDAIVLLLIDGLSYDDVKNWGFNTLPCFVDGPSVTYRFYDTENTMLIPSIGFASIINAPSIFERLMSHGYLNARGYTYWEPEHNIIADYMFRGIPTRQVVNFQDILSALSREPVRDKVYIQIVREGLDGLAHGKRELRSSEIIAAIGAIKDDIEQLCGLLKTMYQDTCVYIVADHGILWKNDHSWQSALEDGSKARFTSHLVKDRASVGFTYDYDTIAFRLYRYPILGAKIPKNDSGVHGGLSYHESLVPFIKIEV